MLPLAAPATFATRSLAALLSAALVLSTVAAEAGRGPVRVAAAASLKSAVEEMRSAFEAENPGTKIAVTLGASGALFAQVESGAPFDLFLSADREFPGRMVRAGLARAEDERVYAVGLLVVWTPPGSALDLERAGLAALADPSVRRIAMANPAVAPFGRAAEAALRAAGVHERVRDRIVLGTSAGQAAQFASTGAAEVAFLPLSLALDPALADGRAWVVPERLYPKIEQSGVVLAGARDPVLARAFLAWIAGEKGRRILARHGHALP